MQLSPYSPENLQGSESAGIDVSTADLGYIHAVGISDSSLILEVVCGDSSYNCSMPNDGSPLCVPLSFGDGDYTINIMQNTSGNRYVELFSASVSTAMASEFEPFIRPNFFCDYDENSQCVAKARELASDCETQADAVKTIVSYVTDNVSYDDAKAKELSGKSGYVPNPDETLESGTGICTDYASLCAAMLRSIGIPTKIMLGNVAPDNLYHAWIEVYINGTWTATYIDVEQNTWSRLDPTFLSSGTNLDKVRYTDDYAY